MLLIILLRINELRRKFSYRKETVEPCTAPLFTGIDLQALLGQGS